MKMGFPLKKEDRRVLEQRAPRKMFGTKMVEITGVW
jgi:hypothetical protein